MSIQLSTTPSISKESLTINDSLNDLQIESQITNSLSNYKLESQITNSTLELLPITKTDSKRFVVGISNDKKKNTPIPKTSIIVICVSVIIASIVPIINPQPFGFIFAAPLLCPGYMHGKKILQWIRNEIKK